MSTICFDIKRVDDNYVSITHCESNKFEYSHHLPFSYWGTVTDYDTYPEDSQYRYVWVLVGKHKEYGGIEVIRWVTDSYKHMLEVLHERQDKTSDDYDPNISDYRIIKLPWDKKETVFVEALKRYFERYSENDLQDQFKLYCPKKLNEKYRVYGTYTREPDSDSTEGYKSVFHDPEYLTKK